MKALPPERAKEFSGKVRGLISEMIDGEEVYDLEEIKRRMREISECIGAWADLEFEEPEELPLPPAKVW